jgi:hypothetical protein
MRAVLAVVAGVVTGSVVITIIESLAHRVYPLPPLDFNDPVALRAAIATLPLMALILVVVGWTVGTLAGARTAVAISPRRQVAWIVGGLFVASTALNLYLIPHPVWMAVAGPAAVLAAAWLVSRSVGPLPLRT